MKNSVVSILLLISCLLLAACGGTEIDKNPTPIVWGEVSFFPASTERGSNKFILNNTRFSGYGRSGLIDRVIITPDETIVENINSNFYSAKKLILKGIKGNYQEAFTFLLSGQYRDVYRNGQRASLPDIHIASWESVDEKWTDRDLSITYANMSENDISFSGFRNCETEDIEIRIKGLPSGRIARASVKRLFLPADLDENPEKIVIDDLVLEDISVPQLKGAAKKASLDYEAGKLDFGVTDAAIPGAFLAEFGIPGAPEVIRGSMRGAGQVTNELVDCDADLSLDGLLDLSADLKGQMAAGGTDVLTFSLTDKGLINYLTDELKAQLAMLALFIPNGQQAVIGFLAKPGQTLSGTITYEDNNPDFKFELK